MEYETVIIYDDAGQREDIHSQRYPIDFVSGSPMTDPNIAPVATTVRAQRYTGRIRISRPVIEKSPSQDARSRKSVSPGRGPKTLGDTNEFIRAFWVNGKPKCRQGYRYDFRTKTCRLIK
jgi:hypothetical protein